MGKGVALSVTRDARGCGIDITVEDPGLVGKSAQLEVAHHARVKRSRPVHAKKDIASEKLTLRHGVNRVELGDALDWRFTYRGEELDLVMQAQLTVDDSIVFDTKIEIDLASTCGLPARSSVPAKSKDVHSPKDRFNLISNLRAIPPKARVTVLWLLFLGGPIVLANAAVGIRDELVPESRAWLYDKTGDDGSESPIEKALTGSGALGFAIWMAIRAQLKRYMTFTAKIRRGGIARGDRLRADRIFEGKSRVPLEGAHLRLVAYNREEGQHQVTEKDGDSSRTVTKSFTHDSRGCVLYSRFLPMVPAETPISGFLDDEIDMSPMFDALYPPYRISSTHGLSVRLEAQLLHPQFVDQDVELIPGDLELREFYRVTPPPLA